MSDLKQVKIQAKHLGFECEVSRPGGGRVRVHLSRGVIQRSFVGSYAAECFLDGIEAAETQARVRVQLICQERKHFVSGDDSFLTAQEAFQSLERVMERLDDERSSLACQAATSGSPIRNRLLD